MDPERGVSALAAPPRHDRRVVVAMSGGVDSSVAAARLREAGWDVAGVTFKLFCYGERGKESKACCGLEGVRDAQATARRLDIPHTVLDLQELFQERVMRDFAEEYGRGRTPNPCVQCNTHVKFGPLLQWARGNGYGHIATGHYVRSQHVSIDGSERSLLARARDTDKDQTYVLWGVPGAVLPRTLFPLGEASKSENREAARRLGLSVWDKEESQDICFVEGRSYADVVRQELGEESELFQSGPIRDESGQPLGTHPGLVHFTVGQRRGLGLGGGETRRVLALETETNTLRVGSAGALLREGLIATDLNLFAPASYISGEPVVVKIRYRHAPAAATVEIEGERMVVRFETPQPAVAPGQSCVVYRDDVVLAGGRIERSIGAIKGV